MIKAVWVFDLNSMNDLPGWERWYIRYHAPEAISRCGPWLTRYVSYRAVPPPPEAERYGYYNYRVSELWLRSAEEVKEALETGVLSLTWTQSQLRDVASRFNIDPSNLDEIFERFYTTKWYGRPQWVQIFVPARPTEDFMGSDLTPDEKTILRWYIAFKYPDGVPVEEGEKWYLNVHSKEVMKQPGLTRYFSHRAVEIPGRASQYPWHRITEMWYENYDGWRKSVIDSTPKYTKPPWAKYDKYPFFEPYVDFVNTFILERPTDDFLRDRRGYPGGF